MDNSIEFLIGILTHPFFCSFFHSFIFLEYCPLARSCSRHEDTSQTKKHKDPNLIKLRDSETTTTNSLQLPMDGLVKEYYF